ncbi:pantetheinase-like [Argiope bruennichi]|uniref:Pantetheinase like protein n=1 Tax=Argiope bruennichi TaxID=94029 RepID=A0A8T0FZI5_ARGBR|nr:pantetheinase-like [Argiope bruennichi]KAF8796451.1 Pantetheinase like protein [Argiope bruennichi]
MLSAMKIPLNLPSLLFIVLFLHTAELNAEKNFYRAAVLELSQFTNISYPASKILEINLNVYEIAARTAAKHRADILVFPESGLLPFEKPDRDWLLDFIEDIPDPKEVVANPCTQRDEFQDRPILQKLSCLAQFNNIYIVANTADFKKCDVNTRCDKDKTNSITDNCTSCPEDGHFFYNTNIVFSRDGTLISKYYKRHLYFEPEMNTPDHPENAYFDTEFGKFTTIICFDLMFKEAVGALDKPDILNVAYPTYWFDHTPMIFFAPPYQQAWAMTNKVNLLAANGHHPPTGSLGSGIYSSDKGALIYTHNPDGYNKLLISNVPISPNDETVATNNLEAIRFFIGNGTAILQHGEEKRNFKKDCDALIIGKADPESGEYRCSPTDVDQYKFKKLHGKEGSLTVCSNRFCCTLSYQAHSMDEDFYFGVSGHPLNFYGEFSFGTESCILARCESVKGKPCRNYLLKSSTIFRSVEITGNFSTKYILPFAVDSDVRLTDKDKWHFDHKSQIIYHNSYTKSPLLFFGMYGRIFDQDKDLYNQPDSARRISSTETWLISVLLLGVMLTFSRHMNI